MNLKTKQKLNSCQGITPFIIFFILIIVKSFFTLNADGPLIFYDEVLYKEFALNLYKALFFNKVSYPLLYPLSLAVAFFFRENFYFVMLLLNILYSSAIIFPVWLISRLFFNTKRSTYCCILAALIPFHLIFPKLIMSENLFFPIFLFTVYVILKIPKKYNYLWSVLAGILIGMLHLTRHIALVTTPVFLLIWWVRQPDKTIIYGKKIAHFLLICLVSVFTYMPWIYMGFKNNRNLFDIMGLHIGIGNKIGTIAVYPESLTLQRFFIWACFYISYLVLMNAPVLNLLMISPFISYKKPLNNLVKRFFLLVIGLSASLGFIVTRHSWRAGYNYPKPGYINGRYITFLSILFLISAFIIVDILLKKKLSKERFKLGGLLFIVAEILSLSFIFGAYFILIKGAIWETSPWFVMVHTAPDAFLYKLIGSKYLFFILLFISIVNYLIWKRKSIVKYVLFLGLIVFYTYGNMYLSPYTIQWQETARHGKMLAQIIKFDINNSDNGDKIMIYNDLKFTTNDILSSSLAFWNIKNNTFEMKSFPQEIESLYHLKGYLITSRRSFMNKAFHYKVSNEEYMIYKLPLLPSY